MYGDVIGFATRCGLVGKNEEVEMLLCCCVDLFI